MYTLILGIDSFDPAIFESLASQGKMPNLSKYADAGNYSRFEVSDPPQTEVSWTSIATGLNPGGHGIFDFVHRDPASYTPYVSLLPTQRGMLGIQFAPPHNASTIFDETALLGYPATSLWWPATFPARLESPVRTIPGLGTPDILGRLGVGAMFTSEGSLADEERKTAVHVLHKSGQDRYSASIPGPISKKKGASQAAEIDLKLEVIDDQQARLSAGKASIELNLGQWSPIFELTFKMGLFMSVRALTRAILTQIHPEVRLYFLPLQIHPQASPWRYAAPPSFVKGIWKNCGPFLTLGWPQDTTGLEEDCISDDQFLDLCEAIFSERERVFMHLIDSFHEGLLACVFDSLDRVQHMFRRDRPDIVERWYIKLDGLVGRVSERLGDQRSRRINFLVLSDHGFSDFEHKIHLNHWLVENNYIVSKLKNGGGDLESIDWSQTQAYAVGLNSLYINQEGREGQGIVAPEQATQLSARLKADLEGWLGPDGRPVVARALLKEEVFSGALKDYGPDLLIGFSPGYRSSPETGLGKWGDNSYEPNRDHWGADHCIDSQAVPGVIFCSQGLGGVKNPSYEHIPELTIGKKLEQKQIRPASHPPSTGGEDKEIIEERLKDLGYL